MYIPFFQLLLFSLEETLVRLSSTQLTYLSSKITQFKVTKEPVCC